MADPTFPDEWLAHSLEGVLSAERLAELRTKATPGRTLWEALVAEKIASDAQILSALSTRFRLKLADVSTIDPKVREGVPEQLARRYRVLPLRITDSFLEVATANPFVLDGARDPPAAGGPVPYRGEAGRDVPAGEGPRQDAAGDGRLGRLGAASGGGARGTGRLRGGGEPAAGRAPRGPDHLRGDALTLERHPHRAGGGRGRGALPHRWGAASGDEDPARGRPAPDLAHQDHVAARHRGPASAPGRPRPGVGERATDRPARLDPPRVAGREGRDPGARLARHGEVARLAGAQPGRERAHQAAARVSRGDHPGHRSHGVRQDDHALLLHQPDQERRSEHRDGGGPGGVPHAGDRAGAGAGEGGADVRLRAAVDPAAGPERRARGRDPRPRDGADRRTGVAHGAPRALDAAHERRRECGDPPRRYRRRGLQDRGGAARGDRPAADAEAVPDVQASVDGGAGRAAEEVAAEGDPAVSRRRLSRLRDDGLPRPLL